MGMRSCAALLVFAAARASALAVQTAEGERHELAPPEGVVSAAATTSGGEALENAHAPFTNELHRVRMSLTDVTRDVEVVEQEGPSVVPASDLRQHMENALHEIEQVSRAPQTLFHHYYLCPCSTRGFAAAQGIASLQRVRRDVEASDRLALTVKTQVRTGSLMPDALNSKQPPHRPLISPGAVGPRQNDRRCAEAARFGARAEWARRAAQGAAAALCGAAVPQLLEGTDQKVADLAVVESRQCVAAIRREPYYL
jgi:hypothetical protein